MVGPYQANKLLKDRTIVGEFAEDALFVPVTRAFGGAAQKGGVGVDWLGEQVGLDPFPDDYFSGHVMDDWRESTSYKGVSQFTEMAAEWMILEATTRGLLKPLVSAKATKMGYDAKKVASIVNNTSVAKNVLNLAGRARGVDKAAEALKLGHTVGAYAGISALNYRTDRPEDSSFAEFVVEDTALNVGLDLALGGIFRAAGKGIKALSYTRADALAKSVEPGTLTALIEGGYLDKSADEIRAAMDGGQIPRSLGEALIRNPLDPVSPRLAEGAERTRVRNSLLETLTAQNKVRPESAESVLDHNMMLLDTLGKLMVRVGKPTKVVMGGKEQTVLFNTLEDFYANMEFIPGLTNPAADALEQGAKRTFFHFAPIDLTQSGVRREFAKKSNFNPESRTYKTLPDGKVDPESAVVHAYMGGRKPEYEVLRGGEFLHAIEGNFKMAEIGSDELNSIVKDIRAETGQVDPGYLRDRLKSLGYDGLVDPELNQAQFFRDIDPKEIKSVEQLTPERRNALGPRGADTLSQKRLITSNELFDPKTMESVGAAVPIERGGRKLVDFMAHLDERAKQRGLTVPRNDYSPEADALTVDAMVEEAAVAMKTPSVAAALGWYKTAYKEAVAILSETHPELASLRDNPDDRFLFTSIIASVSNGKEVEDNTRQAVQAFAKYVNAMKDHADPAKARKVLLKELARHGESISKPVGKVLSLIDALEGNVEAAERFMLSTIRVGDLKKAGFDVRGLGADESVSGAAIMGPKIGAFFANLSGAGGDLTMDRWFVRTWNRVRGHGTWAPEEIDPATTKYITGAFTKGVSQKGLPPRPPIQSLIGTPAARGFKAKWVKGGKADLEAIKKWAKPLAAEADAKNYKNLTDAQYYGNRFMDATDREVLAPNGVDERAAMIRTTAAALARVNEQRRAAGEAPIDTADLQALLWYHEKDLFEKYAVRGRGKSNFRDAAVKMASESGKDIDDEALKTVAASIPFGRAGRGLADGQGKLATLGEANRQRKSGATAQAGEGSGSLQQGTRGQVAFGDEGTVIISAFESADESTIYHEVGHVFRRFLRAVDDTLADEANAWVKAANDIWTPEQEELFTEAFENYLSKGEAPTEELRSLFEMAKTFMLDVYKSVMNSPLVKPLDPKIKDVFDNMLGGVRRPASAVESAGVLKTATADSLKQGNNFVTALKQGARHAINYNHFNTPENAIAAAESQAAVIQELIAKNVDDVHTYEQMVEYARSIGAEEIIPRLRGTVKNISQADAEMLAGKQAAATIMEDLADKISRVEALEGRGTINAEHAGLIGQIQERLNALNTVTALYGSVNRVAGRVITAGNIDIDARLKGVEDVVRGVDPESVKRDRVDRAKREADEVSKKTREQLDALDAADEADKRPKKTRTPGTKGGGTETPDGPLPENPGPPAAPGAVPGAAPATPTTGAPGTGGPGAGPGNGPGGAPGGSPPAGPTTGGGFTLTPGKPLTPAQAAYLRRLLQSWQSGRPGTTAHLQTAAKRGVLAAVMEIWTAFLLSGMKTVSTNTIGNLVNTMYQPMARFAGELGRFNLPGAAEALGTYHYLASASMDMFNMSKINGGDFRGFRAVADALMHEKQVFDSALNPSPGPAFVADTFGLSNQSVGGRAVNAFGSVARAPGLRLLGATDEFFLSLNYVAYVKQQAAKEAASLVKKGQLRATDIGQHIDATVKAAFDKGAAAADFQSNPLFNDAYQYAMDVGFKTPLGDLGVGKWLQTGKDKHPWLGFIFPFVKTPVNIFRSAARMVPGYGVIQNALEAKKLDLTPDQLTRRRGDVILGLGFSMTAAYLALNERMTGGGPSSLAERRVLESSGWRPYSLVVKNSKGEKEYISFSRIEPIGSALAIAADFAEVSAHADEFEALQIAQNVISSFVRNATSKTYVTGISEFTRVLNDPAYVDQYLKRMVSSAVVPSAVSQFAVSGDDNLREAHTIIQAIKRRVPGLSETLPPRRNLLGEPVTPPGGFIPWTDDQSMAAKMLSPAALSRKSTDLVINELAELRAGLSAPYHIMEGINLRDVRTPSGQEAHDRYLELVGEVGSEGYRLHDALNTLFSSEEYQSLPESPYDAKQIADNPRAKVVNRILLRYREAAKAKLIEEVPELRDLLVQKKIDRAVLYGADAQLLEGLKR